MTRRTTTTRLVSNTVLAPTNDAFEAMDEATLDQAMNDPKGQLTDVLTHHVVEGELAPEDVSVVCGNVQTANATVYIVDSVLMPAAE